MKNFIKSYRSFKSSSRSSLDSSHKDALETFFSEALYTSINADTALSGADPFAHFLDFGFDEGRIFSSSYDINYINSLPSGLVHEGELNPSSLMSLARVLIDWDLNSVIGPSPFICPIWLSRQKIFKGCNSLPAIMKTIIPIGEFNLHPGIKSLIIDKPIALKDLIELMSTSTDLNDLSLLNLDEYCINHSDLNNLGLPIDKLFNHLWSRGIDENRLKYLGCKFKLKDSFEHKFFKHLSAIYRESNAGKKTLFNQNNKFLVPRTLHSSTNNIDFSLALSPPEDFLLSPAELVDKFYLISLTLSNEKTYIVNFDYTDNDMSSLPVKKERPKTFLLDEDLFCGLRKVTTKRVVYSVNLGNYDDIPTPPPLEDCSYFLITDLAYLPENSPWEIVRPTLKQDSIKRLCLWYKTHPHILFPDAEFVTWIDSNIICTDESVNFIYAHETISELATFSHPDRSCTYEEANVITNVKLDKKDVIERVCKEMIAEGFPEHAGLYETNVLFSRISDHTVRRFFDLWWSRIYLGSRRDQMSFAFSAWKLRIDISELDGKRSSKNSRFFSKIAHKHARSRYV